MTKKEQFALYLMDNWGCESINEFAMKVVDALDDGKIEDVISVSNFIETNYGKSCCNSFLYHFKGILLRRNSKRNIDYQNSLMDAEVDAKCADRALFESVFDEYSGEFLDGFCEEDLDKLNNVVR